MSDLKSIKEYGETWRMIRKVVHNNLNIKAARTYVPYQDLENKAMLVGLLDKPDLFIDHIRRYTSSLHRSHPAVHQFSDHPNGIWLPHYQYR
jgi:hypothetical protein